MFLFTLSVNKDFTCQLTLSKCVSLSQSKKCTGTLLHYKHQVLKLWLPSYEKFKEKNKVWKENNVCKRSLYLTINLSIMDDFPKIETEKNP